VFPDGRYGDGDVAQPNASAEPTGSESAPESLPRAAPVGDPDTREPDTLTRLTVAPDGSLRLTPAAADNRVVPLRPEPAPTTLANTPDPRSYEATPRPYPVPYGLGLTHHAASGPAPLPTTPVPTTPLPTAPLPAAPSPMAPIPAGTVIASPASDAAPPWVDDILDPGAAGSDGPEPPIWRWYQELAESQVDDELRASVLRAGWLALRGRIGGEA
jgi:hypothetical protein